MATAAAGMIRGGSSYPSLDQVKDRKKKHVDRARVFCVASSAAAKLTDPYETLRIRPGASESEVKKAFRQLALKVYFYIDEYFSISFLPICFR